MKPFDASSLKMMASHIDFCLANIQQPECTLRWAGRFYEELCAHERALGILYLLLQADIDGFYTELVISARAFRQYLHRCTKEGYSDFYRACSRWDPFFDALAAKDMRLAYDIASLSPVAWMKGDEYEDDFCYAKFLHGYVTQTKASELGLLLTRFEGVLERESARMAVCKTLFDRDQAAFEEAFDELLLEQRAEVARQRKGLAAEDICAAAGTHVFVEGIGLLRIAEMVGLKTRRDYLFCPAMARSHWKGSVPEDVFSLDH